MKRVVRAGSCLPGSVPAKDPQVVVANRGKGRRGKTPEMATQAPLS